MSDLPTNDPLAAAGGGLPASHLTEADLPPSFLTDADLEAPGGPAAGVMGTIGSIAKDIGKGLAEAPAQVLRGAGRAVNATMDATHDAAGWLNTHVADLGSVTYDFHGSADPRKWDVGLESGVAPKGRDVVPNSIMPGEAHTVTGGLIEGVSQFTVGMLGAGKFLRAFGITGASSAAAGAAVRTAEGGAAMATVFDPHEKRLADLIQSYPALENPVTEFLATHPDDGPGMARVRAGLEGLGLGAATEGLIAGLKGLAAKARGNPAEAIEHLDPTPKPKPAEAPKAPGNGTPESPLELPEVEVAASKEPQQLDFFHENPDAAGKSGAPGSPRPAVEANPAAEAAEGPGTATPEAAAPQAKKLVELTPADIENIRELRTNVDRAPNPDADGVFRPLHGINTDMIEHSGDLSEILSTLRTYMQEPMDAVTGGTRSADGVARPVRTFAEVQANVDRLADMVGADPKLMMQRMGNMTGNIQNLDAETRLYGNLLATVGDRVHRLSQALDDPSGLNLGGYASRAELEAGFGKHIEMMATVQANYQGIQTNVARALNAFKMGAKIDPQLLAAVRDPSDLYTLARRINAGGGNPVTIAQQTRPGFWGRMLGMTNEYWINSVLSGPKTHVVNMVGNTMSAALLPAERMIAGALKIATPAGREEFLEGGLHYAGMAMSLRDAITMSARALRMGDGILDASHTPVSELRGPSITAANLGMRSDTLSGVITNGIGATVRLPSRFLTSEDEFFKQLVYRGAVRARAMREAFQAGMWNDPKNPTAFGDHISKALSDAATATGQGTDDAALQAARYATFQTDLAAQTNSGARTIGESLQEMSNEHPLLKLVIPFVRTPTNMMRFVWDRSPGLNLARGQFRNDFMGSNGPAAQSQAMARMATGGTLWAAAVTYVSDGTLTGAGPADKESQKALKATGWQPYSVRHQNEDGTVTYRSYDRMDPFGTFFGLAADFAEVAAAHPERKIGDIAAAMTTALAKNVENKTYVSGLTKAIAALADPGKRGGTFAQGLVGGFMPSFMRQTLMDDTLMREARSLVDGLRARTPGFSEQLDPQRNILGAPVHVAQTWGPEWMSPIAESRRAGGDQPVSAEWRTTIQAKPEDELARLMYNHGAAITPPPHAIGQLDLTQLRSDVTGKTAYDRLQELTGTVQVGGMTLRERIADTVKQGYYHTALTDGDALDPGSRVGVMQKWVGAYRQAAQEALTKEQPAIGEAILNEHMRKARTRFQ